MKCFKINRFWRNVDTKKFVPFTAHRNYYFSNNYQHQNVTYIQNGKVVDNNTKFNKQRGLYLCDDFPSQKVETSFIFFEDGKEKECVSHYTLNKKYKSNKHKLYIAVDKFGYTHTHKDRNALIENVISKETDDEIIMNILVLLPIGIMIDQVHKEISINNILDLCFKFYS